MTTMHPRARVHQLFVSCLLPITTHYTFSTSLLVVLVWKIKRAYLNGSYYAFWANKSKKFD